MTELTDPKLPQAWTPMLVVKIKAQNPIGTFADSSVKI